MVDAVKDKTLTLTMRYSTNAIIKMKLNRKPYGNVILTFFHDVFVCMSCDESFFCVVIEGGISKSSIKFDVLNVERIPCAAISFDTVLLIRLNWWPTITTEWKEIKQNWPNNENIINNLTKEVHIIATPTIGDKCNKQTIELRHSFTHVE